MPPVPGDTVQFGLAGVLAGTLQNKIIIAGGSNFRDKLPWNGGIKKYYDDIFILTQSENDAVKWEFPANKLPLKMAYSACVSTGEAIYCLGGEDESSPLKLAFKIYWGNNQLQIEELPLLPFAVSNSGVAIINSKLYLVGGNNSVGATSHLQMLDLLNLEKGWQILPDLPVAESHAVVASQSDGKEECVYVVGGRYKNGITSTFMSNIQKYSPGTNKWTNAGELEINGKKFGLSAGTGIAYKNQYILLFGGDKGEKFNRTEQLIYSIEEETEPIKKEKIIAQKITHLNNHPGFDKEVLLFNTFSGKLETAGNIPGETQVTTNAFLWNEKVIIPGGEIRPGVRTPLIREATITRR
jgi:cyclically-permuted mutarotase family protein